MPSQFWLVCLTTVALAQSVATEGPVDCKAVPGVDTNAASSSCAAGQHAPLPHAAGKPGAAQQAAPLTWRALPYKSAKHGKQPVYGGDYVVRTFAEHGFAGPVHDDDWDVLFTHFPMTKALASYPLPPRRGGRLVHHCQYFLSAGQKCHLARHIDNVLTASPGHPHLRAFRLSNESDLKAWRRAVHKDPEQVWVVKPCAAGRSAGIRLVKGKQALGASRSLTDKSKFAVAQAYIMRPYLLGGRKFHLRHYLLITRWEPVGALLFDEGMLFHSRLLYDQETPSVERDVFSGVSKDVDVLPHAAFWRHLDKTLNDTVSKTSHKRIVEMLREVLQGEVVKKTFGALPRLAFSCFDFYGLDVMFDEHLQPFLLEINIGPNIWVDVKENLGDPAALAIQREVKEPLVSQLVHWMSLRAAQTAYITEEAARLIEDSSLTNFTRVL